MKFRKGRFGNYWQNGAGKSTFTEDFISDITYNRNHLRNGRIASLLEVGTGFHPEMTEPREYISERSYLMTKPEIRKKFDEIVDFAGVEQFIDTPVKRYSSGMLVRLGFAVAAHLDPEILIVDEVLAVGDAEFQRKAIGKMEDISKGQGRTVLFVSHNMASVVDLCKKTIVLSNGYITNIGPVNLVVADYLESINKIELKRHWENNRLAPGNMDIKLRKLYQFIP